MPLSNTTTGSAENRLCVGQQMSAEIGLCTCQTQQQGLQRPDFALVKHNNRVCREQTLLWTTDVCRNRILPLSNTTTGSAETRLCVGQQMSAEKGRWPCQTQQQGLQRPNFAFVKHNNRGLQRPNFAFVKHNNRVYRDRTLPL